MYTYLICLPLFYMIVVLWDVRGGGGEHGPMGVIWSKLEQQKSSSDFGTRVELTSLFIPGLCSIWTRFW